jgi:hypothetical protein
MTAKNQKGSEPVPIDPHLIDWAEYWYPISWKGVLAGGVITAIGACATIAFLLLQWRTTSIREQQSELRTATLETQTEQAKAALGTAQANIAKANAQIAAANEGAAKANERAATLEREAAVARLEQERLKNQMVARRVSAEQRDTIIAGLAGKTITFASFGWASDQETGQFAQELWMALSQAGVKLDLSLPSTPLSGFGVLLSGPADTPGLANVSAALSAAGIPFAVGNRSAHLQIMVGPRPPLPSR